MYYLFTFLFICLFVYFESLSCVGISKPSEIVIAIDGSGDVTLATIDKIKKFIQDLLSTFQISSVHSRVSIVVYGESSSVKLKLPEGTNIPRIQSVLSAVKKVGGKRDISSALLNIQQNIFNSNLARTDAGKYVILFVNGPDNPIQKLKLENAVKELKALNVQITVVGIGNKVNEEELTRIGSTPNDVVTVNKKNLIETIPILVDGLGKSVAKCTLLCFMFL